MAMSSDGFQLEMNFDSSINRFRHCLDNGVFVMLIELNTPARDTDLAAAGARLQEIEYAISNINELPIGLAFTDKYVNTASWKVADYATCLRSGGICSLRFAGQRGVGGEHRADFREWIQLCGSGKSRCRLRRGKPPARF